jgi:hypothetical protein
MFYVQAHGITYYFVWFSMTDFLSPLYIVAPNRRKQGETGINCIIRRFVICTFQQIVVG